MGYRYAVGVGFCVLVVGFNVGLLVDVDGVGGSAAAEVDATRTGLVWGGGMVPCDM